MQTTLNSTIGGDNFASFKGLVAAAVVADEPPGFAHEEHASAHVPAVKPCFPVAVETPCGDPCEIERGGPETPYACDIWRHGLQDRIELVEITMPAERNARRDQAVAKVLARRNAQALVLEPGTPARLAQKLSSVIG